MVGPLGLVHEVGCCDVYYSTMKHRDKVAIKNWEELTFADFFVDCRYMTFNQKL